jgi:hypothetical protein
LCRRFRKQGEACSVFVEEPFARCEDGLDCLPDEVPVRQDTRGICVPRAKRGEGCVGVFESRSAELPMCVWYLGCSNGVCTSKLEVGSGESCDFETRLCGPGSTCSIADFTCAPIPGISEQCTSACEDGSYCAYSPEEDLSHCVPRRPDGAACGYHGECHTGSACAERWDIPEGDGVCTNLEWRLCE